jgi:amidase
MKATERIVFSVLVFIVMLGAANAAEFSQRELAYMPATMQIELFKRGVITPVDVLKAQKAEFEATNDKVNAATFTHWDDAMKMAEDSTKRYQNGTYRELEGITVGVKDEFYDEGWVVTFGSLVHKNDAPMKVADPLVAKVKAAGAIPVMGTTVPELYFNQITDTLAWGTTRNPWNLTYTCGASSGGSGAGLAAGYFTVALGSDMGGSIRIPSALNGLYGMRPGFGAVHTEDPLTHISSGGPMARTFGDLVMLYNVIDGPTPLSPNVGAQPEYPLHYPSIKGMKIAYLGSMGAVKPAKYVDKAVKDAIKVLEAQGAQVDVIDFDFEIPGALFDYIGKIALGGPMGGGLVMSYSDKLDQMTHYGKHFIEKAMKMQNGSIGQQEAQIVIKRMYAKLYEEVYAKGYDVVLAPTVAMTHVPAQHDFTKGKPLTEDGVTYPLGVLMQYGRLI